MPTAREAKHTQQADSDLTAAALLATWRSAISCCHHDLSSILILVLFPLFTLYLISQVFPNSFPILCLSINFHLHLCYSFVSVLIDNKNCTKPWLSKVANVYIALSALVMLTPARPPMCLKLTALLSAFLDQGHHRIDFNQNRTAPEIQQHKYIATSTKLSAVTFRLPFFNAFYHHWLCYGYT